WPPLPAAAGRRRARSAGGRRQRCPGRRPGGSSASAAPGGEAPPGRRGRWPGGASECGVGSASACSCSFSRVRQSGLSLASSGIAAALLLVGQALEEKDSRATCLPGAVLPDEAGEGPARGRRHSGEVALPLFKGITSLLPSCYGTDATSPPWRTS